MLINRLFIKKMNTLDIVLFIPLIYGLIHGFIRGFFKEVASLLGIILGIYMARIFAVPLSHWLITWLDYSDKILIPTSYILIFLSVAIGLNVLAFMLEKMMKFASLGWLNKLGGAAFGMLKFALVLSVLLNAFSMLNNHIKLVEEKTLDESLIYTPVKDISSIFPFLSFDEIKKTVEKTEPTNE